jgi:hypothetical protein
MFRFTLLSFKNEKGEHFPEGSVTPHGVGEVQHEIPDPKTRRFQELNGIQGRCVTCIGRAETDSQQ